jgi:hypothetical protein
MVYFRDSVQKELTELARCERRLPPKVLTPSLTRSSAPEMPGTKPETNKNEPKIRRKCIGVKERLIEIKRKIDSGMTFEEVQEENEHFSDCIRYPRALKRYSSKVRMDRLIEQGYQKKEVYVYIGPPDAGQKRHVRELFEPDHPLDLYPMPESCHSMRWAGNYNGEPAVVFDDVSDKSIMPITSFLKFMDGYPIKAKIKWGFVPWGPKIVYITSHQHPDKWYPNISQDQRKQMYGRITCIRQYEMDGTYRVIYGTDQTMA